MTTIQQQSREGGGGVRPAQQPSCRRCTRQRRWMIQQFGRRKSAITVHLMLCFAVLWVANVSREVIFGGGSGSNEWGGLGSQQQQMLLTTNAAGGTNTAGARPAGNARLVGASSSNNNQHQPHAAGAGFTAAPAKQKASPSSSYVFNPHRLRGDRLRVGLDSKIRQLTEENYQCQGKEKFLEMILLASDRKVEISRALCRGLPTMSDVRAMWGATKKKKQGGGGGNFGPVVHGLNTCEAYRRMLEPSSLPGNDGNGTQRLAPRPRVAGLYNTGTNALNRALNNNLKRVKNNPSVSPYEVPWGKHLPPDKYRLNNTYPSNKREDRFKVLPIVVIRDPYFWFQSLCKAKYDVTWGKADDGRCPNLIMKNKTTYNVTVSEFQTNYTEVDHYASLADMWSEWYMQYFNADYPRLIVRFEDILYRLEEVVDVVRDCVGMEATDKPFRYLLGRPKFHGDPTDILVALKKYADDADRYNGLTNEDKKYASKALNSQLMEVFKYPPATFVEEKKKKAKGKEGIRYFREGDTEFFEVTYDEFEADHPEWNTNGNALYTYARVEKTTNMVFEVSESVDEALKAYPPTKVMYLTVIQPDGSPGQKFKKQEYNKLSFDDLKELAEGRPFLELRISIEDYDNEEDTNSTQTAE